MGRIFTEIPHNLIEFNLAHEDFVETHSVELSMEEGLSEGHFRIFLF